MTSALALTASPPPPAPRTSRWSTSRSASCHDPTSNTSRTSSTPSASSTTRRSSHPSATRCSRPSSRSSTPTSSSPSVRESLTQRAREFNIVLDDVAITHLAYGPEFSQAVEKKQVAQQEAERSRFLVARAEQERRAAIVRAEGESEAARLISEATTTAGNGLIELRRIEAAKEIAGVLARTPNVSYIPAGDNGQMLLVLNAAR